MGKGGGEGRKEGRSKGGGRRNRKIRERGEIKHRGRSRVS